MEIGGFLIDQIADIKLQGVYLRDVSGLKKPTLVMDKNTDTMIDMSLGLVGVWLLLSSGGLAGVIRKLSPKPRTR